MTDYAKFTYSKEANTVGCFESLISHKKSAMVVNVNNATRDTHNRRINISRRTSYLVDLKANVVLQSGLHEQILHQYGPMMNSGCTEDHRCHR